MPGRERASDRAGVHVHLLFRHVVDRRERPHRHASPRGRPAADGEIDAVREYEFVGDRLILRPVGKASADHVGADQVSASSHPLLGAWRYVDALLDGKSTRPNGKGIIYYAPSGDMVCQVSPGNVVGKAGASRRRRKRWRRSTATSPISAPTRSTSTRRPSRIIARAACSRATPPISCAGSRSTATG